MSAAIRFQLETWDEHTDGWQRLLCGAAVLVETGIPKVLRMPREIHSDMGVSNAKLEVFECSGLIVHTTIFVPVGNAFESNLMIVGCRHD